MFFGILLGSGKPVSLPPGVAGDAADELTAETTAKLEKIKEAVPVAERIAFSVVLDKSWKLMEIVREAVHPTDS